MIVAVVPIGASSELGSCGGLGAFLRDLVSPRKAVIHLGLLLCAAAIATLVGPAYGQKTSHPPPSGGSQQPVISGQPGSMPQIQPPEDPFLAPAMSVPGVITVTPDSARTIEAEACNSWTDSGVHSPTVSVTRLEVPDKASGEFQKACSSYKGKRYGDAEGHARRALDIYPEYAASWVLLGQVLDAQHHQEAAGKACSQAATVDPTYIAPYLCLAEFAARTEDWRQVSQLSDQALAIDPTSNAYALYYSAAANFHLQNFLDAEQHARAAVDLDPWHHLPQVHLLLANIYATKGDTHSEATELKEFLKIASNSTDAPGARVLLKELENPPPPPTGK
jgi:Tetratricopeptide repeat